MYSSIVKSVPIKELKENLSLYAEQAAQGEQIEVTRYNKPYITLMATRSPHLHTGKYIGKRQLAPVAKHNTHGAYLKTLQEDRE